MFEIEVASAVDAEYLKHALSVANSVAASSRSSVRYHLIYDGPDNQFSEAAEAFRAGQVHVQLHRAENPLRDLASKGHLTAAGYLRLIIPEVLDSVDRVVYLDADVTVHRDLSSLFETKMSGNPIAGVVDLYLLAQRWIQLAAGELGLVRYLDHVLQVNAEQYVNAGVLVMELGALRTENFTSRALAIARERHSEFAMLDQDVINTMFYKRIELIDPRWNFIRLMTEQDAAALPPKFQEAARMQRLEPYITHYAGARKPWHVAPADP